MKTTFEIALLQTLNNKKINSAIAECGNLTH